MNPYQAVRDFETAMAEFTGSLYAVAVESCSIALEMCCHYVGMKDVMVTIPSRTYPSVPAAIIRAGGMVRFKDSDWQREGVYELGDTGIFDSAKRICRGCLGDNGGMYLVCLSFHARKVLPIGRGGMILTASETAADWFRTKRHDGRHDGVELMKDTLTGIGWNAAMTPEQAARGLILMGNLNDINISPPQDYPDLSKYKFFTQANRQ